MATFKLLCFFLWHMTLLGSALGAGLGLVYGATLMLASLIVTCAMDLATCFGGAANLVGGVLYFAVAGAVFGLLLGALGGSALGLVDGFALGISTRFFFLELRV
jgi:hypothetical protein